MAATYVPQNWWDGNVFRMPPVTYPGVPQVSPVQAGSGQLPGLPPVPGMGQPAYQIPARDSDTGRDGGGSTTPNGFTFGDAIGANTSGPIGLSPGMGKIGGLIGSAASLATSIPGLGLIGNAIGTGIETAGYNNVLDGRNMAQANNPSVGFWSSLANNATLGALGQSAVSQFERALEQQREYDRAAALSGLGSGQPTAPSGTPIDINTPLDAQISATPDYGGWGGGLGSDGSPGGPSGGSGGEGMGNGGNAWAAGGMVTQDRLRGPDPRGPDTGSGKLQAGEYVVKKAAVDHYGPGLLEAINAKAIPKSKLRGLLAD